MALFALESCDWNAEQAVAVHFGEAQPNPASAISNIQPIESLNTTNQGSSSSGAAAANSNAVTVQPRRNSSDVAPGGEVSQAAPVSGIGGESGQAEGWGSNILLIMIF